MNLAQVEGNPIPTRDRPVHLVVPFLNSAPLWDLKALLLLTPFLWLLGIEQFVAPVVVLWSVLKVALRHPSFRVVGVQAAFAVLIIVMCVSAVSISEPLRYVTFARSLGMIMMGACISVILATQVRSWIDVRAVLLSVLAMMAMASALGLVAILGVFQPRFEAPIGNLLPAFIANTDYADRLINRSVGNESWFRGLGTYFRINSIFLFSTTYAAALAIIMPISLYFVRVSVGLRRGAYLLVASLLLVNLVFTTGRMAWISLVVAGLALLWVRGSKLAVILKALSIASVMGLALFLLPQDVLLGPVEAAVLARGEGSVISRSQIYSHTLEEFARRPLIGWGTERDIVTIDGFPYPAGSHSMYLGFLYKHGLFGLAALIALMFMLWRETRMPALCSGAKNRSSAVVFMQHVRWALLTASLIAITTALDLDTTLMFVTWIVVMSGMAARRVLKA